MPVKHLPLSPNLNHLKSQAKDLLKQHASRDLQVAQRIREFHPRFHKSTDGAIFDARLRLSDAQLAVAREYGFASWSTLKKRVEKPPIASSVSLPHHERIEEPTFRRAVELLDAGDLPNLSAYLKEHPSLVHQHVTFEGGNYFRNPTLLEFVAENPVRRGKLPDNIVPITKAILDAGAKEDPSALNETLALVSSGCVPRECRVQAPLIDLLCAYRADPNAAMSAALPHGEFEADARLIHNGARVDLPTAAGVGRTEDCRRLLATADADARHRALALAAQFGHEAVVKLLLEAGEDPNRYNPVGTHPHSTPLHQAAAGGHANIVRLLVEHGAHLDMRDTLWQGTPADWAKHEGKIEIEEYLRAQEKVRGQS